VDIAFYSCLKAVLDSNNLDIASLDTVGFCPSYEALKELETCSKSLETDVAVAREAMHTKLWRCFKDLFYIGSINMPAIHFCGCVDAKAMLPTGAFHGYNERTLSVKDALDLKTAMLNNYQSMGLETIFLTCVKPLIQLATDSEEGWASVEEMHPNTAEHKLQLLNQFCLKQYHNMSFVPTLAIPSCGRFLHTASLLNSFEHVR